MNTQTIAPRAAQYHLIPGYTPKGRKLTVCPKQSHGITCDRCQLCAKWTRKTIVVFLAHGNEAKYV